MQVTATQQSHVQVRPGDGNHGAFKLDPNGFSSPVTDAEARSVNPALDIIQSRLRPATPSVELDPQQMMRDANPVQPQVIHDPVPHTEETPVEPQKDENEFVPQVEEPEVQPEPQISDDPESDIPSEANAENFKKLRAKMREVREDAKTKAQRLEELEREVEEYNTGKKIPDTLKSMEERISELSHYEKLHNLKMSPEYKDKFIKPLGAMQNKLGEIAKDYNLPIEVMKQAFQFTNRADLNRFLSEHFDEVGATEVKGIMNNIVDLQQQAQEAEKEPARMLQQLEAEHAEIQAERNMMRKTSINHRSRDAWSNAIARITRDGVAKELIYDPNNSEHNTNFVKPIRERAAQEFGKIVKDLYDGGLEVLDEKVAEALATAVLLGHASAVSIQSREAALAHAAETSQVLERRQKYNRPNIGGFGNNGGGTPPPRETVKKAGDSATAILNSVLGS